MFNYKNYRDRKILEVDTEVQAYRKKLMKRVEELALECARQQGEYEHTFHSEQEKLNTEIARIKASKESMTKDIDNLNAILKEKNLEIERLYNICLEFLKAKVSIVR